MVIVSRTYGEFPGSSPARVSDLDITCSFAAAPLVLQKDRGAAAGGSVVNPFC